MMAASKRRRVDAAPTPVVAPSNISLAHLQRLLYVLHQLVIHRTKIVVQERVKCPLTQDPPLPLTTWQQEPSDARRSDYQKMN
eukprot:scaffold16815_cov62-Cyclotella_meneghiniana.AAC.2